jgi:hypothetical protein
MCAYGEADRRRSPARALLLFSGIWRSICVWMFRFPSMPRSTSSRRGYAEFASKEA